MKGKVGEVESKFDGKTKVMISRGAGTITAKLPRYIVFVLSKVNEFAVVASSSLGKTSLSTVPVLTAYLFFSVCTMCMMTICLIAVWH